MTVSELNEGLMDKVKDGIKSVATKCGKLEIAVEKARKALMVTTGPNAPVYTNEDRKQRDDEYKKAKADLEKCQGK